MAKASVFDLWLWPLEATRTALGLSETLWNAGAVISARTPMINAALSDPLKADVVELTGMVTEKWDAFGKAATAMASGQQSMQRAVSANLRDMEYIAGGGIFGPASWWRLAERNLALWSTFTAFPGTVLDPIRTRVASNARRLRV